ncbi:MAG TPA: lipopolysaccharide kinase InaA family protein [Myxococcota bacterium]|nr:lipopolysaccharide kinase InaA family protein [Myxococcota bacterium]
MPPGFVAHRAGDSLLVVAHRVEAAARAAGLCTPDAHDRLDETTPFEVGRAATALLELPDGGPLLVVRRVRHGGWLGALLGRALLGVERPLAELRVSAALRERCAPVAEPAFVLAHRRLGPVWNAAVATVAEEGARDALAFLGEAPSRARTIRAARAAGRAVRRFHDAGGWHRDLHVKNLLVRESAEGVECIVIDLDRARLLAELPPAARMRQLMRLYRSLVKRDLLERVGARGLAAFFGAYVGRDRALRTALRARLPLERARLALHAWRYRRS